VFPWPAKLSIGGGASGCVEDGTFVLEVQSDVRALGGYLDLVHWMANQPGARAGRLVVPGGSATAVLDGIATLEQTREDGPPVGVVLGGAALALNAPDFTASAADRANYLEERERASARPPAAVEALERALRHDRRFVAYRNLGSAAWYGKVEGLRLCEFDHDGQGGTLRVGSGVPKSSTEPVREAFRDAVGADSLAFTIDGPSLLEAAAAIRRLIDSRENGPLSHVYREARLEARVLRGDVPIAVAGGRAT
jgi:hypothetical protein